jgi:hypothetical protein
VEPGGGCYSAGGLPPTPLPHHWHLNLHQVLCFRLLLSPGREKQIFTSTIGVKEARENVILKEESKIELMYFEKKLRRNKTNE